MRYHFLSLSRRCKQWLVFSLDVILALSSTYLAFILRLDSFAWPESLELIAYIASFIFIPIFIQFGLYRSIFRYSGLSTIYQVNKAALVYAFFYFTSIFLLADNEQLPKSIGILQPGIFASLVIMSRTIARLWLYSLTHQKFNKGEKRILMIYGAGSAGVQISMSLANSREFELACFIDDNPSLNRKQINGVTIYSSSLLKQKIKELNISDVLIAMPSLAKSKRLELIAKLSEYSVYVRTLPNLADLVRGRLSTDDIQDLNLSDLLAREPLASNHELISEHIKDRVILITGAGGSIGSEISRQILFLGPRQLIVIDHSELALYQITEQLKQQISTHSLATNLVTLLGDIKDYQLMLLNIKKYQPDIIYHAAAYKHVPIVEENPMQGIVNNTFGTLVMAQVAIECGVKDFVLISTDKAVRPTNVMGASKRLAELCLQALASESQVLFNLNGAPIQNNTVLTMVRFGNVLGSSGSVVPLFRQQILSGGPITLTDRHVTRYFMSISEATQLVIQAGIMSKGGEVFVLDMGNPIKIADLAKRMIQLMGKSLKDEVNPNGDIEIQEVGLRSGEKLHEELLIGDNPGLSDHPKIMVANEVMVSWAELSIHLSQLRHAVEENNLIQVKSILTLLVTGYSPNQSYE
jgi:FlaA1/EpsC-like NDP-sugar epimerase